nr:hypothetical protein Iba_chr04fCG10380 [Ipomoea batatas]
MSWRSPAMESDVEGGQLDTEGKGKEPMQIMVSTPVSNINQTVANTSVVDVPTVVVTEQKRRRTYEEDLEQSHELSGKQCALVNSVSASMEVEEIVRENRHMEITRLSGRVILAESQVIRGLVKIQGFRLQKIRPGLARHHELGLQREAESDLVLHGSGFVIT